MLTKLAFRNAKRSIRDYLIYIITMTGIAALMYAFNSLLFCRQIMEMCTQSFVFAAMLGIATFVIVLIMSWLINYMVRFMLEKRSKEFGTYLLIGMKKKEVSRLYMNENRMLGCLSVILGMLLGVFLQQILMTVFYSVFGQDYHLSIQFSIWCPLLTLVCYMAGFILALRRNHKLFRSMQIIDFMHMSEKSEKISIKKQNIEKFFFLPSLLYLIAFMILVYRGHYQTWPAILAIVLFIIDIYLLYIGASAWMMTYLNKKSNGIYKQNRLFLLRQLSSKLRTMRFTFATITLLFTCALLGSSVAMMFSSYQNQALSEQMPFDTIIYSNDINDDFREELNVIQENAGISDSFIYHIYQNGTTKMNDYLYTHNKAIGNSYKNQDGSINRQAVAKDGYEYFDYDTYMKLSDYNRLRKMLGLEEVFISDQQYLIQAKCRIKSDLAQYVNTDQKELIVGNQKLCLSEIVTDGFSQNGMNGADYIFVIPDRFIPEMTPYYSDLAVVLTNKETVGMQKLLDDIRDKKNHIIPEAEFDKQVEEGEIDSDEVWDNTTLGGSGSDQIICCSRDVLVSNEFGRDMRLAITSVVFPLAYIGLVFVCAAFTILAVQQLSDSVKYKFRYDVLRKLGMNKHKLNKLVLKQLGLFYLMPVGVAIVLSGIIACFAGIQFVKYTGVNVTGLYFYFISLFIFTSVYLIYFITTYLGFSKNIRSDR